MDYSSPPVRRTKIASVILWFIGFLPLIVLGGMAIHLLQSPSEDLIEGVPERASIVQSEETLIDDAQEERTQEDTRQSEIEQLLKLVRSESAETRAHAMERLKEYLKTVEE